MTDPRVNLSPEVVSLQLSVSMYKPSPPHYWYLIEVIHWNTLALANWKIDLGQCFRQGPPKSGLFGTRSCFDLRHSKVSLLSPLKPALPEDRKSDVWGGKERKKPLVVSIVPRKCILSGAPGEVMLLQ